MEAVRARGDGCSHIISNLCVIIGEFDILHLEIIASWTPHANWSGSCHVLLFSVHIGENISFVSHGGVSNNNRSVDERITVGSVACQRDFDS